MKQAFFFDIDGTLYSNKYHELTPGILEEFEKLNEEGADIYLISSRSPYETGHLPADFMKFPFKRMIFEGGASYYQPGLKLIDAFLIKNEQVKKVNDYCKTHDLLWRYSGPDGYFYSREAEPEVRKHQRGLYLMVPQVKKWEGDDVCMIILWTKSEEHRQAIKEMLPQNNFVFYDTCIEILPEGVSKHEAIKKVREKQNYNRVTCFGDGMNDREMLRQADYGVAPANGNPKTKEVADEIVDRVENGGVTEWLRSRRKKGIQS